MPDYLKEFKEDYLANSSIGNDLGDNLRKIRFSIKSKGKGKSGGGRLIIYELVVNIIFKHVVLVTIYDKSEMETMTTAHYKAILKRNDFK